MKHASANQIRNEEIRLKIINQTEIIHGIPEPNINTAKERSQLGAL